MKIWERAVVARLRREVAMMFALRVLMERYIEGWKELRCVFVDQEKA